MPRPITATAPEPGALTASAISFPGKGRSKQAADAGSHETWQSEAWNFYDCVGELRYGANWIANVASQSFLYAGKRDDNGNIVASKPTSSESKVLGGLFGGTDGQQEMTRSMVLHLNVAGEVYIILRAAFEDEETEGKALGPDGEVHEVLGTEEVSYSGDTWWVNRPSGIRAALTESDAVIRVWVPHPKDHSKADSPVRGILGTLAEIRLHDAHIKAQSTSRLLGGGVLFLPNEITLTPPQDMLNEVDMEDGQYPSTADTFTWNLMQAMEGSKILNGSPASVAPLTITMPGEHINDIKHVTFWSELDEKVIDMRTDAITRLARGMDLPPEIFLGTSEMNRWGAWQVEESSIKAHVEPVLKVVTTALTIDYLQPALKDKTVVVSADTSKLRLRPNRSKEAVELYDRGVLSRAALIRETGFAKDDLSDDQELQRWILLQMVRASWSPDQAAQAAQQLGITLKMPDTVDDKPRESRPTPSLEGHPVRDKPKDSVSDQDHDHEKDAAKQAAAAAVSVLAARAMERAGNRLKSLSRMKPEGVSSMNVHTLITPYPDRVDDLLKDAWDEEFLGHLDATMSSEMIEKADAYCREILTAKRRFNSSDLRARLVGVSV